MKPMSTGHLTGTNPTMLRRCLSFASLLGWMALNGTLVRPLQAQPDPDLFDGRLVESRSQPAGGLGASGSGAPLAAGATNGGGESDGSSERDYESIGGVSAGQSIEAGHSKQSVPPSEPATGGASGEPSAGGLSGAGGSEVGEDIGSEGFGKQFSVGDSASTDSGSGSERSFAEFGFGDAGRDDGGEVEVKSSKQSSEASNADAPPVPISGSEASQSDKASGASGSAPHRGSATGDRGSNIPSGI